jgi:phytoene desaturase
MTAQVATAQTGSRGASRLANASRVPDTSGFDRSAAGGGNTRVAIIGAGPGGLANAMLMAKAGAQVTVFERAGRVGGRCSAIEADGFRFDTGPTFFLYPRVLEEIFRSVGRELRHEVPMTRLDPQYRLEFGAGGRIDATPDIPRMQAEIQRICPADAASFERFMVENRVKLERFRPILESPFSHMLHLLRPSVLKALPLLRPWNSVADELGKYFSDPRLITAFSFQSKYLGMSPFQCPSLFTILAFLEYEFGVFHPTGGCAAVSEKMAEIAVDLGVDIRLNEPVEELFFEGRKAVGLRTRSGEHRFDSLVINADFANTMQQLVPNHLRRRWHDKKLERSKYSCSTFMLYLGLEGRADDLPHHTIYIAKDYEKNLAEIDRLKVLSEDPSFYVQNASVTDHTLAPEGMSTLYVLVPVAHQSRQIDWPSQAPLFRERVLRQLAKIGLHDVEQRIRFEKMVTPDDWRLGYQIYRGATFNLAHNLGQMLHQRPRNQFDDLQQVYLVGGGTHPGSGLPVIYESARISARLMCEALRLPFPEASATSVMPPLGQSVAQRVA